MNSRRSFFTKLAIGIATLPALAKAAAELRGLRTWTQKLDRPERNLIIHNFNVSAPYDAQDLSKFELTWMANRPRPLRGYYTPEYKAALDKICAGGSVDRFISQFHAPTKPHG